MIDRLFCKGFACFQDQDLPLKRLTVFSGDSDEGRQAVLQALGILVRHRCFRDPKFEEVAASGAQYCHIGCAREFEPDPEDETFWEEFHDLRSERAYDRLYARRCAEKSGSRQWRCEAGGEPVRTACRTNNLWTGVTLFPQDVAGRDLTELWSRCRSLKVPLELQDGDGDRACQNIVSWMESLFPEMKLSSWFWPIRKKNKRQQIREGLHRLECAGEIPVRLFRFLAAVHLAFRKGRRGLLLADSPDRGLAPHHQRECGRILAFAADCGVQVIATVQSEHMLQGMGECVSDMCDLLSEDVQHTVLSRTPDGGVSVDESADLPGNPGVAEPRSPEAPEYPEKPESPMYSGYPWYPGYPWDPEYPWEPGYPGEPEYLREPGDPEDLKDLDDVPF